MVAKSDFYLFVECSNTDNSVEEKTIGTYKMKMFNNYFCFVIFSWTNANFYIRVLLKNSSLNLFLVFLPYYHPLSATFSLSPLVLRLDFMIISLPCKLLMHLANITLFAKNAVPFAKKSGSRDLLLSLLNYLWKTDLFAKKLVR